MLDLFKDVGKLFVEASTGGLVNFDDTRKPVKTYSRPQTRQTMTILKSEYDELVEALKEIHAQIPLIQKEREELKAAKEEIERLRSELNGLKDKGNQ